MKTKLGFYLLAIVAIATSLFVVACEKQDITPASQDATEVLEKRGGNGGGGGNGGNNGGGGGTTTPPLVYWPLVWVGDVEMNITSDTTTCGFVIFRWDNQPNFSAVRDTQYTLLGYYYLKSTPLSYTPQYPCQGGMYTNTNSYYYTLNSGCSFTGNHTFEVVITYYWKDVANQRIVGYVSKPITVRTGRNQWECGN